MAREAALGMAPGHTRLVAVVETPDALPLLGAIAAADPRVVALGIGAEDLSTELGAVPGADLLYHFGMMVVAAARAAGIQPMGSDEMVCHHSARSAGVGIARNWRPSSGRELRVSTRAGE